MKVDLVYNGSLYNETLQCCVSQFPDFFEDFFHGTWRFVVSINPRDITETDAILYYKEC